MSPSSDDEIRLGWTEEEWDALTQEAKKRGISPNDLIAELAMEVLAGKAQAHRAQIAPTGRHLRIVK